MTTVYFRSNGNLIKVEMPTDDFKKAQNDAFDIAVKSDHRPNSPMMAVIGTNNEMH